MLFPTREELSKIVYVSSQEPVTAMWDGKEYHLSKDPVQLPYGIVHHWKSIYDLDIKDVPPEDIERRQIVNPLEIENQGEAFAAVKRRGRPKEA